MVAAPKDVLKNYLQGARDVLLWKLKGLSERDQRLPRTPTGTNLLGLVKHALNTEAIYFGPTFGREWPTPGELVSPDDPHPLAGWYATETETAAGIVGLYRRVQAFADGPSTSCRWMRSGTLHIGAARRSQAPLFCYFLRGRYG
jgi:hypothetical protein